MVTREQLDSLAREINDNIPAISRGGCCVLASMMVDALAHHGVEAKAIAYDWGGRLLDDDDEGSFGHVCIKLNIDGKEQRWDDQGFNDVTRDYDGLLSLVGGEMDREQVRKRANNWRVWNRAFNRQTQIPKLRRIIRKHLSLPPTVPLGPQDGLYEDDPC